MIALQRDDQRILLTKRTDDGSWCLPAGAAERGGSFARTAIDELAEETGIEVELADLVPFGCLSEAEAHTIRYPNGDLTHCFALLFLAEHWQGEPTPNRDEQSEAGFFELDALPEPMHAPTDWALDLLAAYRQGLESTSLRPRVAPGVAPRAFFWPILRSPKRENPLAKRAFVL